MPPKLKGLQHIGLKVRDIEVSLRFYTEILGFRVNEHIRYDKPRGQRAAQNFITCTDMHHVINLTQNALAASSKDEPGVVRLTARRLGSSVVLEVSDEGQGISKEDQKRMFELFFSTRKGGTGLGLAIVKRIAKDHGAGLVVESEPGAGTTVRLTLASAGAREGVVEHPGTALVTTS